MKGFVPSTLPAVLFRNTLQKHLNILYLRLYYHTLYNFSTYFSFFLLNSAYFPTVVFIYLFLIKICQIISVNAASLPVPSILTSHQPCG